MSRPCTDNICVTTTAMPRPELIEPTYRSFQDKMNWLDFKKITLFLNIDLFPANHGIDKRDNVIEIANSFFGKVVVSPIREPASFPNAVRWCFSSADKEFILNIEDDWILLSNITEDIAAYFDNSKVMQVGFRAWKLSDPRFVLSPSIIRNSFCKNIIKNMNSHKNPEQQIRELNQCDPKEAFIYWPIEEKVILKDTGRSWMKNTEYARGDDEFVRWRMVQNPLMRKMHQEIRDQNKEI